MPATQTFSPGTLVTLRGRDWIVQPSETPDDLLVVKPLGGSDEEITGIFLPLDFTEDRPRKAEFPKPSAADLGNITSARLLYEAARLSFRNGAGPFRCLAKISFRPRAYQMVPLIMALKLEYIRLLIADDVGIGKTIEALLIVKELLERRIIKRFAIVCLPHLCDQWQREIREKIGMDAVVIRSNTQARLDREIVGDTSVYQFYPFQIISIDYIKSDQRRAVFIQDGPEMVVVDEAHSCACPQGASTGQQQRHALIHDLAKRPERHLVLLTATPHSGKTEEFQSLLGLLDPKFANLDPTQATDSQKKHLAQHYIQRRRGDVSKWTGGDTPFPEREAGEVNYDLSPAYAVFFDELYRFARGLITGQLDGQTRRVHYWTALGLLRGVMSSPAAGVMMLQNRQSKLARSDGHQRISPEPECGSRRQRWRRLHPGRSHHPLLLERIRKEHTPSPRKIPHLYQRRTRRRQDPQGGRYREGLAQGRTEPRHLLPIYPHCHLCRRSLARTPSRQDRRPSGHLRGPGRCPSRPY